MPHQAWEGAKSKQKSAGYYLSWEDISVSVKGVSILEDVSGYCAPGTSLCVLGASGAGKTTLIDVLSQRKTVGDISGQLLVNGSPPDKYYKRRLGYVLAETVHIPILTVRETLEFAANLRMPRASTEEEKTAKINSLLAGLKLSHVAETRVGNELIRGLSSGEKKRLDIAIELLAQPKLLFLDEPTSGLDEFAARVTMKLVLDFVKSQNLTVITIIHQPSLSVFNLFDNVCLLGAGKVCYFGKVSYAETFFGKMGQPTPQYVNPIEHYLDVISAAPKEVGMFYDASDLKSQHMTKIINAGNAIGSIGDFVAEGDEKPEYEQPFSRQFTLLLGRVFKRYMRSPSVSWGRLLMALLTSLVMGGAFFQLESDLIGYRLRMTLSACLGFIPAFMAASALPQFLDDRDLYFQEYAAGFYGTAAYHLSYFIIEAIILEIIVFFQVTIIFAMAGFNWATYGEYIALLSIQALISISVAQCMACWSRTLMQAFSAMVAYGLIDFVFSGVAVNIKTLNNGFLQFLSSIDYWRYTVSYLLKLQFSNFEIVCKPDQMVPVNMNALIPSIASAVQTAVTASFKNPTAPTAEIVAYLELASLATFSSGLMLNPVTQTGLVLNPSVLPLPAPASTTEYSLTVASDIKSAVGASMAALGIADTTTLKANILNTSAWYAWNATLAVANAKLFPDYSRCFITDSASYIAANFDIDQNDPTHSAAVYPIALTFFVFHAIVAHIGLHASRRYKQR